MRNSQLNQPPLHNIVVNSQYSERKLVIEDNPRIHDGNNIAAVCSAIIIKVRWANQGRTLNGNEIDIKVRLKDGCKLLFIEHESGISANG